MKQKLFTLLLVAFGAMSAWAEDFSQDYNGQTIYYNITSNTSPYTVEVTYQGSPYYHVGAYSGEITIPTSVIYNNKTYSVTGIGERAFEDGSGLTSVTIGNSVTSIGDYAFQSCSGLTSVTIGNSVASIGERAFMNCSGLTSINVDANNLHYSSGNGVLFNKDQTALILYPIGKAEAVYAIPNTVMSIGSESFFGCSGLTSITIPNSVTSIEHGAFEDCSGLTSINIPESVTSIGYSAFDGCSSLTSLTIPASVTSIEEEVFFNCSSLASINVEANNPSYSSVNGILFSEDQTMLIQYPAGKTETAYTIPNTVTDIIYGAFYKCLSLREITLSNSLTTIGIGTFFGCSSLTSITIPNLVTSIEEYAFADCSSLTSVTIPNSVTSIEADVFLGCSSLIDINVDANNSIYSSINGVLFNKDQTTLIQYPVGKIEAVYIIPNTVISIESDAFYGCGGLMSIAIPNSVTSIGSAAFGDCSNLQTVYNCSELNIVAGSAENGYVAYYANEVLGCPDFIDDYVFIDGQLVKYLGSDITEITLPQDYNGNAYAITDNVFKDHTELTSITISNSVTSIGEYAFSDCTGLTSITCLAAIPPVVTETSFSNYNVYLYVPCSSLDSYNLHSVWGKFKYIECISEEITDVEITTIPTDGIRYNVLGQPVDEDYKGIVIVNGKKYLVK